MNNVLLKLMIFVLIFAVTVSAQEIRQESKEKKNSLSPAQWVQDIDYLIKRLEITHPNLYANVSREKFYKEATALREKSETAGDFEMIASMIQLLALVRDGHTVVDPIERSAPWIAELFTIYPMYVYYFSDGLFITSAMKKYSSIAGKKVIRIGSVSAEEAMKRVRKCASADNIYGEINFLEILCVKELLEFLEIKDDSPELTVTLEDAAGKQETVSLEAVPFTEFAPTFLPPGIARGTDELAVMDEACTDPLPLWLQHTEKEYWYTVLTENNSVYLQINKMDENPEENFETFCGRMFAEIDEKQIDRLIIDLRLNGGGRHFELPLLKGIIQRKNIDTRGNLFLLTGRATYSAAEHLVVQLTRYTNVISLGEPTSGKPNQYGNTTTFQLPNSGLGIICSQVYHQSGQPEDYTTSSEPDFLIPLSSDQIRFHKDNVLEAVLAFPLYKEKWIEFSGALISAYESGGTALLKEEYYKQKPVYAKFGFNPEKLLYDELDGTIVSIRKSREDYIEYLKFMHEEMPNAIRVSYDLASWLEATDVEMAKQLFKRCLELNPAHHQAERKLGLLELESIGPGK